MRKSTALLLCGVFLGCGGEHHESVTPYALGQALLIGPEKGGTPSRLDAVCETGTDDEQCRMALRECGSDAYADVVLAEDQRVLDVICYPGNASVRDI